MLSRLPRDPLAAEIDHYLRAEGKVQEKILAGHDGRREWNPSHVGLDAEFARFDRLRAKLFQTADLLKQASAGPRHG